MRIHQITDLHVPEENNGSDFEHVRPNVLKQLSFIESDHSDLLVISGDLTMKDASTSACEWISSILPPTLRTIIMPGNHDDPQILWDVFGPERCIDQRFFFVIEKAKWNLLFLNTSTDRLPGEQLEFLAAQSSGVPCILFIHHPPDLISGGFMALNQPLLNHAEVSDVISASSIEHVFCGHYHNSVDKVCDRFHLHLTPSPAFQVDLHSREFKMEAFQPAVRVIDVRDNSIQTQLVYV